MKRTRFVLIVLICVICPVLVYLVANLNSVSSLMSPPKQQGENAQIRAAFEKSVEDASQIVLTYPSGGEYRSAYIQYDIDNDDKNEVLVFYTLTSDPSTACFAVIDYISSQWKCIENISGYGSGVNSVSFDDLNNDGILEMIITWSVLESKTSKVFTIHEIESDSGNLKTVSTLSNQIYSFMKTVDIDNDGNKEVFYTSFDSSGETEKANAGLFKMDDKNNIYSYGTKISLDGSISSYSDCLIQTDSNGKTTLFLDATKGENSMITEIIEWDSTNLNIIDLTLDSETLSNHQTLRTPAISSRDIDDDDLIEVPFVSSILSTNQTIYSVEWKSCINGNFVSKKNSLYNYLDSYMIVFDFSKNLKASIDKSGEYFSINDSGTLVYSIVCMNLSDWSKDPLEGYSILLKNSNKIFALNITDEGKSMGYTQENISDSFLILE